MNTHTLQLVAAESSILIPNKGNCEQCETRSFILHLGSNFSSWRARACYIIVFIVYWEHTEQTQTNDHNHAVPVCIHVCTVYGLIKIWSPRSSWRWRRERRRRLRSNTEIQDRHSRNTMQVEYRVKIYTQYKSLYTACANRSCR